jgi:magnesium-transporting ATPase (P-type)
VYDDWYITFYNLVFTALPLLMRSIYERDIQLYEHIDYKDPEIEFIKNDVMDNYYPFTYAIGQNNLIFTKRNFAIWWFTGVVHSAIAFFIPLLAF